MTIKIKRNAMILGVTVLSMGLMMGCTNSVDTNSGAVDNENRQVIEQDDKTITVIENTESVVYQDVAIKDIQVLENMYGVDWLSDDKVLILKENKSLYEGLDFHVSDILSNLYVTDLTTGEERLISDPSVAQMLPVVSKDKQYIYYVDYMPVFEGEMHYGIGRIVDMDGNEVMSTEERPLYDFYEAVFSRDNELLMSDNEGNIKIYKMDGTVTTVENVETDRNIRQIGKVDDEIYFTILEDKSLWVYDMKTEEKRLVAENAPDFTISPEGDQMVLTKVDFDKGTNALVLLDLNDEKQQPLTEGSFIYGVQWSPDGSRITYMKNEGPSGDAGMYVMVMETQKEFLISKDYFGGNAALWNSTGEKLLLNQSGSDEEGWLVESIHIITLI